MKRMAPAKLKVELEQRKLRGERLRCARELVVPNRSEFARLIGVDTSTIRKFEDGERNLSAALLDQVTHSLRITVKYIMHGDLDGVDQWLVKQLLKTCPERLFADNSDKDGRDGTFRRAKAPDAFSLGYTELG